MAKLTLQAGSTFWFDYPADPPARFVPEGSPFTIDDQDFAQFAAVGIEIVEGKLPAPKPSIVTAVVTKVAQALGVAKPEKTAEKFICEHCNQVFTAARGLEIHLYNAHKDAEIAKLRDEDALQATLQAALTGAPPPEVVQAIPEPAGQRPVIANPKKSKKE